METAYLKNAVGPVLAKAVAETVVAQPSNPQEYLALYLLHYLQEEQQTAAEAKRKCKADEQRTEWLKTRALAEKSAVDTIQRGFQRFRVRLLAAKDQEKNLAELYEEAENEAEDLLERESTMKNDIKEDAGEDEAAMKLQDKMETMEAARAEFYRAHRFFLSLQKGPVGYLKRDVLLNKERVRIALDAMQALLDRMSLEEDHQERALYDPKNNPPHLSPAATELQKRISKQQDHTRVSVPLVLFRVLRCLCYLLLDSTPAATDSATKVAALLKPSVIVQQLRALNPVATYDRNCPLKLEKNLPHGSGDDEGDQEAEVEEGYEPDSVSQPKTRQVRRVQRVLRTCMLNGEYVCEVSPSSFLDEEQIEENAALLQEMKDAEAAQLRATGIRESVERQVKERGGLVLWALLRYLRTAVDFRTARDDLLRMYRDMDVTVPPHHETPEDEEEDLDNDEALMDDDGELDLPAVKRLQERIGTDVDELIAKTWEKKDAHTTRVLQEKAEAYRREAADWDDEEVDEDDA